MYTENQIIENPSLLNNFKTRDMVPVICSNCNTPFERIKRDVRKLVDGRGNKYLFCSKKCCSEHSHLLGSSEVSCKLCGTNFRKSNSMLNERGNNFCCSTHSAIYNNITRGKKNFETGSYNYKGPKELHVFECLNCRVINKSNDHDKKYCNFACQAEYRRKQQTLKWLTTGDAIYSSHSGHYIRKYLYEKQNNKCAICEIENVWQGKPLVLILDHIDGNSSNNAEPNLRLVCSNCDSQLPTYKAKNKNSGRHYRKQRYRDGKSF